MVQRERARDDVEGGVAERQPFAFAAHERQALVVAGAPPRDREHRFAAIETRSAHVDAAPPAVAHERMRHVAAAAADVEDRARAGAPHLAPNRRDAAEPAVRKFDVGEVLLEFVRRVDRTVHQFERAGSAFHRRVVPQVRRRTCVQRRTLQAC